MRQNAAKHIYRLSTFNDKELKTIRTQTKMLIGYYKDIIERHNIDNFEKDRLLAIRSKIVYPSNVNLHIKDKYNKGEILEFKNRLIYYRRMLKIIDNLFANNNNLKPNKHIEAHAATNSIYRHKKIIDKNLEM